MIITLYRSLFDTLSTTPLPQIQIAIFSHVKIQAEDQFGDIVGTME